MGLVYTIGGQAQERVMQPGLYDLCGFGTPIQRGSTRQVWNRRRERRENHAWARFCCAPFPNFPTTPHTSSAPHPTMRNILCQRVQCATMGCCAPVTGCAACFLQQNPACTMVRLGSALYACGGPRRTLRHGRLPPSAACTTGSANPTAMVLPRNPAQSSATHNVA